MIYFTEKHLNNPSMLMQQLERNIQNLQGIHDLFVVKQTNLVLNEDFCQQVLPELQSNDETFDFNHTVNEDLSYYNNMLMVF